MSAYISVPRDLSRVKTKVFLNLTKRQIICFGAGALVGLPLFFTLKSFGNVSFASMCMIISMMPMFLLAMYEKDGQPLEVVARHFYEARIRRPRVRPYQTNNYYAAVLRQYQTEKEVEQIVGKAENAAAKAARKKAEGGRYLSSGKHLKSRTKAD